MRVMTLHANSIRCLDKTCNCPLILQTIIFTCDKECVAVLTMLYKKNDVVIYVGSTFLSDWALHRIYVPYGVWEGGSYTWITSWTGFDYGQISIETATHSFLIRPLLGNWPTD